MDKIISSAITRLNYITNNTENAYILKQCKIISIKIDDIKAKKYIDMENLNYACDSIINDINNMKGVSDQTNMLYKKMNELEGYINQIREVYFTE